MILGEPQRLFVQDYVSPHPIEELLLRQRCRVCKAQAHDNVACRSCTKSGARLEVAISHENAGPEVDSNDGLFYSKYMVIRDKPRVFAYAGRHVHAVR
jgi:hypothetical protein